MSSIAHLFVAGGFVMYPLVIFLLFTLMIGIERIFLYRKFTKDLHRFNKVLEKNQSWIMLPSVLERDTEELGSLFARAIRSAKNYNGLENRLQDVVSYADERLKLQQYLPFTVLKLNGTLATSIKLKVATALTIYGVC